MVVPVSPPPARRRRHRLFVAILILALAIGQEALCRAVFPLPEIANFNRVTYSEFMSTDDSAKHPLVNASFTWSSRPDGASFTNHLNRHGFRDRNWRIAKGSTRRVAIVGDSFVEGFMATDEETLPRGFERRAAATGAPLEVLNLGVGAAQLPDYFRLIRDALVVFRPDDIVLVLYANDVPPPAYDPAWLADPIVPQGSAVWRPRLLDALLRFVDGRPIARRWCSAPFPFLAAVPSDRNPWTQAPPDWDFVAPMIAQSMKDGAFNPYVVDNLLGYQRRLRLPADLRPHLTALAAHVVAHQARLSVAYLPFAGTVSDHYLPFLRAYSRPIDVPSMLGDEFQLHERSLRATCAELGIPFHSLGDDLRAVEAKGEHLYWDYDEHLRGRGYLLAGEALYDWWRAR